MQVRHYFILSAHFTQGESLLDVFLFMHTITFQVQVMGSCVSTAPAGYTFGNRQMKFGNSMLSGFPSVCLFAM